MCGSTLARENASDALLVLKQRKPCPSRQQKPGIIYHQKNACTGRNAPTGSGTSMRDATLIIDTVLKRVPLVEGARRVPR